MQAWRTRKKLTGGKENRCLGILEPKSKMPRRVGCHFALMVLGWANEFLISPAALPSTQTPFSDPDGDFCSVLSQARSSVLSSSCSWTPDLFHLFALTKTLCAPRPPGSVHQSWEGKRKGEGRGEPRDSDSPGCRQLILLQRTKGQPFS